MRTRGFSTTTGFFSKNGFRMRGTPPRRSCPDIRSSGASGWRGASITTTTTSARATPNALQAPQPSGRWSIWSRMEEALFSCGSTTSIHTIPTSLQNRFAPATRHPRISERSPIWTGSWGDWSRPSKSDARVQTRGSWWSAITARGSAITASFCMGICSIRV